MGSDCFSRGLVEYDRRIQEKLQTVRALLTRLLKFAAPGIEPEDTLEGIIWQLDNAFAGIKGELNMMKRALSEDEIVDAEFPKEEFKTVMEWGRHGLPPMRIPRLDRIEERLDAVEVILKGKSACTCEIATYPRIHKIDCPIHGVTRKRPPGSSGG